MHSTNPFNCGTDILVSKSFGKSYKVVKGVYDHLDELLRIYSELDDLFKLPDDESLNFIQDNFQAIEDVLEIKDSIIEVGNNIQVIIDVYNQLGNVQDVIEYLPQIEEISGELTTVAENIDSVNKVALGLDAELDSAVDDYGSVTDPIKNPEAASGALINIANNIDALLRTEAQLPEILEVIPQANAVSYVEQNLTEGQQKQARKNIGALTETFLVSKDGSTKVGYQLGNGSLRTVADKLNEIISVKDFGAKGDGITDDTSAIQSAISNNPGAEIYFPDGTYLIKETISTTCEDDKVPFIHLSKKAILKASSEFSGDYVVHLGAFGEGATSYSATKKRIGFTGGIIDGNTVANGLLSENTHLAHLYNFDVINAKQIGLKIAPAFGSASSADAYVHNINVLCANSSDIQSVGFWIDAYDCDIRDVRAGNFVTGIRMLKGGYCSNAHPIYGNMGDSYNESVGFDIKGVTLTDCYADNFSTAIKQNGNIKWSASNFIAFWYANTEHNHTVIKVSNTDQFAGYVNGLTITLPTKGVNRGIWIDHNKGILNQYSGSLPQNPHIYNLQVDETFWQKLTYRHTDPIFDNQIRNIYLYGYGNDGSSTSAYKIGYWYPLVILSPSTSIIDFKVSFKNILAFDLSCSIDTSGISFLRAQSNRNAAGSKISIRVGKIYNHAGAYYYVIYFKFDSHEKSFSPTYHTIKINQNTFNQRYIIPIRAAHNYDSMYQGLLNIDNPVGDIISLDLGTGAQEDHRPLITHMGYSKTHSINIENGSYFQRLFVHFATIDQIYLIQGTNVRLIYSSQASEENPVKWTTNGVNKTIDFTFPSLAIISREVI